MVEINAFLRVDDEQRGVIAKTVDHRHPPVALTRYDVIIRVPAQVRLWIDSPLSDSSKGREKPMKRLVFAVVAALIPAIAAAKPGPLAIVLNSLPPRAPFASKAPPPAPD